MALAGLWPGALGARAAAPDDAAARVAPDKLMARARLSFDELAKQGLPGALVGVQSGAGQTEFLALGVADLESGASMLPEMTMRLGSIAKLFVGTIALQLADEGRIDLDESVSTYRDDVPGGEEISLRMLGNHTSGLFNPLRDPAFRTRVNRAPTRPIPPEEVLSVAFDNAPAVPPGEAFHYSNANTVLLADILERASGEPLMALLRSRLLVPYGAESIVIPSSHALAPPAPRGYRFGAEAGALEYGDVFFDATDFSASWAGAAGNMNGTLGDLLRLGRVLAAGETLSESSRRAQRDSRPIAESFGYGFCLARYGDALGHAGDVPGFSSFLAWQPERDVVVVVLTNLSNLADKSAPATSLGQALLSELETA